MRKIFTLFFLLNAFVISSIAQVTVAISSSSGTTICSGNSVQLNATVSPSGIYQYQWVKNGVNITGANGLNYFANSSGTYFMKVTNLSSNVFNSDSITVIVNTLPTAPSVTFNSPAIICNGGSVNLSDSLSSNVSYQWHYNNNVIVSATNNTYTANNSGTYKLVVSDLSTGCSNTSQEIIVGEMPKIVSDTITTCGDSISISLSNSNFSYTALPASCNVNMSDASTVNTTVAGSAGSQKIIVCYGGNFTNGGGSNTYVVEYGGTLNGFGGGGSCIAYIKAGGIYNNNSGGGGGNIVYYEPGAIINAGTTQTIQCNSIGVIYPSNTSNLCNNLSYQWSNGATTPTIRVNPTVSTVYSVTITKGTISCTDQVTVIPASSISGAPSLCKDATTQLIATGTPAASNPWTSSDSSVAIVTNTGLVTGKSAGTATIIFTSVDGCQTTQALTVNAIITPTFTQVGPYNTGASIPALPTSSTNGITGTWSPAINNTTTRTYTFTPGVGQCAATSTMMITVNQPFNYTLAATDSSVCAGTSVTLSVNAGATSGAVQVGSFYSGGVVGYIYRPGDQGYVDGQTHGIIVATNDQSTGIKWGCPGQFIGGTSDTLGFGLNNTNTIVSACNDSIFAAGLCFDLVTNGYSDWYLPSIDELEQIYSNRLLINSTALANGGSALGNYNYWSSTENTATDAWYLNFGTGVAVTGYFAQKQFNANAVRAVRAF